MWYNYNNVIYHVIKDIINYAVFFEALSTIEIQEKVHSL